MLIIRPAQMAALELAQRQRFSAYLAAHAREIWPRKCALRGETGLTESVWRAMDRSERYGITYEADVTRYLDLMLAIDDDFDTHPRVPKFVRATLQDDSLSGSQKMALIWTRLRRMAARLERLDERRGQNWPT